jgi:hypothetical protein
MKRIAKVSLGLFVISALAVVAAPSSYALEKLVCNAPQKAECIQQAKSVYDCCVDDSDCRIRSDVKQGSADDPLETVAKCELQFISDGIGCLKDCTFPEPIAPMN